MTIYTFSLNMNLYLNRLLILTSFLLLLSCQENTFIIDGYQDKISYSSNETITVYLNAKEDKNTSVSLFDINGNVVSEITTEVFKQNLTDTAYWWKNGFDYKETFRYKNSSLKSGIYYFKNCNPFIIKNPTKTNDILVVYPSNTDNAYNKRGGRSSYSNPLGEVLSFKRPTEIQKYCLPFLQWLPKQNFKVDYCCDADLEDYENLKNYKVIIVPGHSEYWSRQARLNLDKFVNNGGNAIILSGNTMWWQVRYENGNMICYKDAVNDSLANDSLKTIQWAEPTINYPILNSIGADFNHGGFGTKNDNGWNGYKITSNSPLFKKTGIEVGDILKFPTVEYDGAPLVFMDNKPQLDTTKLNFYQQQLLGYDKGYRTKETHGTLLVFQKTKTAGIVINVGSTNWCSDGFTGESSKEIKALTTNFIAFLVEDREVFE
jgi:hypothetical protein